MPTIQQLESQWSVGKTVVFFSASWCGHCQAMKHEWTKFTKLLKKKKVNVKAVEVESDKINNLDQVEPHIFGFPTIRSYQDGEYVTDYDDSERTAKRLMAFAIAKSSWKANTGGRRVRTRRHRRSKSNVLRGGGVSANAAPVNNCCESSVGTPVDVPSKVPPGSQWNSPYESAPPAPHNGGLYTGPPASGPWASIPVTPTTAEYINSNLRSASGTPDSLTQYPNTNRLGNNFSAMPGVFNFAKQGRGPNRIHCTSKASATGGKRSRRTAATRRRRRSSRRGGLNLTAPNMDKGAPFHPIWKESQGGGRRKRKVSSGKKSTGGLHLVAPNMDEGPPFHPRWSK